MGERGTSAFFTYFSRPHLKRLLRKCLPPASPSVPDLISPKNLAFRSIFILPLEAECGISGGVQYSLHTEPGVVKITREVL